MSLGAVPSSNLLKKALSAIHKEPFIYRQFSARAKNDIGIYVPSFTSDTTLYGSIQAVPRRLYQLHGLDYKKNYITIYSTGVIEGVQRDTSGDRVVYNGKLFQVLEENDWQPMDGWNGVICVEIGTA